jgi:hypothetical protein
MCHTIAESFFQLLQATHVIESLLLYEVSSYNQGTVKTVSSDKTLSRLPWVSLISTL